MGNQGPDKVPAQINLPFIILGKVKQTWIRPAEQISSKKQIMCCHMLLELAKQNVVQEDGVSWDRWRCRKIISFCLF